MALPLQIEPIEYRRTWDNAHAPVKLHLIVGGQAQSHRQLSHSIYLRRRVAALVLLVTVVGLGSFLVKQINATADALLPAVPMSAQEVPSAVSADEPGTLRGQVIVPEGIYVAQRGDTLWVVARALKPTGDLSGTIRKLVRLNGGPSLEVGQRVSLPD